MEEIVLGSSDVITSRIGLGTWAIGGWMWGGTDEKAAIETIHSALDKGINLIDTAPVYGFGKSEEIVGRAVAEYGGNRKPIFSTKATLDWSSGDIRRNGSREQIMTEVEDSLRRLRTDTLDIYYVHWPDCSRPIAETAAVMRELYEKSVVRAIGVSNFTPDQMRIFASECPLHLCQPPFNIFERGIEQDIKPFCEKNDIALMTYGAICRGLLSGKMSKNRTFNEGDLRLVDPKFKPPEYDHYLEAAERLKDLADHRFGCSLAAFSLRWIFEKGVPIAIWGARTPSHLEPLDELTGWSMDLATFSAVDSILSESIPNPLGPEFMAPPTGVRQSG